MTAQALRGHLNQMGQLDKSPASRSDIRSEEADRHALDRLKELRVHLGQFAARIIEHALLDALPATWERRARDFDAVPHPEVAAACRERAEFLRRYPDVMVEAVAELVSEEVDSCLT